MTQDISISRRFILESEYSGSVFKLPSDMLKKNFRIRSGVEWRVSASSHEVV